MKTLLLPIFLFITFISVLPCCAQKIMLAPQGGLKQDSSYWIRCKIMKGENLATRRPVWLRTKIYCFVRDSSYNLEIVINQRDTSSFKLNNDASYFLTATGDSIPLKLVESVTIRSGLALLPFSLSKISAAKLRKDLITSLVLNGQGGRSMRIKCKEKSKNILKDDLNRLSAWFQVKNAYKRGEISPAEFRQAKIKYLDEILTDVVF